MATEEETTNRLAQETSPYLLMHSHNPVDWYPWGEEAFAKARRENKPVFLSIGYSSCYWCHVMERESFTDDEIAKFLNEHFVCIKVDREERPDVDDIYMMAAQLLPPHRGGWPLSAFLTPGAKPFHVGTYFPARTGDRPGGMPGFLHVIKQVSNAWQEQPDKIGALGDQVADRLKEVLREQATTDIESMDRSVLDSAQASLARSFDPEYGGFGYSPHNPHMPKFPSPPNLMLLLEQARDKENVAARKMLLLTLEQMAQGGIRDHVGGGFHRYSTDRHWLIPHFEKMLYDNGQLATVYAEAFALTDRDDFRRVVVELLDFVLREMTDKAGAFYSAIDAETDAEEGKFYRWEDEELEAVLDDEALQLAIRVYGLGGSPNFEGEYHVPFLAKPLADVASDLEIDEQALEQQLVPIRQKLLEARDRRPRPLTDTKILTAWNGLMIRGFADAGRILKEPKYTQAAERAADFLLDHLQTDDGRLFRSYREGEAKLNAYLDDYAFLIDGLLALDQATGDPRWREAADRLMQKQIELFWDDDGGGFYFTSDDHETLIARAKKRTDSVLPSGNAVAVQNLLALGSLLSKPEYTDRAEKTIAALGKGLDDDTMAGAMPGLAIGVGRWWEMKSKPEP